jgi:outer membrane immunogenic protein
MEERMRGYLFATMAAAAATFSAAPIAAAADLPQAPVYTKAPPVAPAADWTGFYLGLGVGARSANANVSTVSETAGPFFNVLALVCGGGFGGGGTSCATQTLSSTAFRFDPYIGFNWQFAPQWVAGFEGDFGFANNKSTLNGAAYPGGGVFNLSLAGDSFAVKSTWDAGARLRLGYLVTPTFLLYATGGAAWQHVAATATCNDGTVCSAVAAPPLITPFSITDATTRLGYSIGGGIETMLTSHWLARAEYRYADFGSIQNSDTVCTTGLCGLTPTGLTTTYKIHLTTQTASFGLAYKF